MAEGLLTRISSLRSVVADRAYDADALLHWLADHDVRAVIPSRRNRRHPRPLDRVRYASRNVVERFFGRLKRCRRVGTRVDKTARSFEGFVALGMAAVARTAWT